MTLEIVIGVFVWLLGLCVGSFLNVVVYRLPAGLSIGKPARSFCPACRESIAWYDNIPVLSWLMLGARCRRCAASISLQYPLVEAITGLAFVLIYYLLFADQARYGAGQLAHPTDWPLLLAWLALAAALIACSAMDVVSYMVDVRITYVALATGIALHAGWPRGDFLLPQAAAPIGAAAVAACLISAVMLWLPFWRVEQDESEPEEEMPAAVTSAAPGAGGRVAVVLFIGLTLWLLGETALHSHVGRDLSRLALPENVEVFDATPHRMGGGLARELVVPTTLLAIFAAIVLAGGQRRQADAEVTAAIEEEQPQARGMALRELRWLLPTIGGGVAAYLLLAYVPSAAAGWQAVAEWSPGEGFCPMGGAAFALLGAAVGAAAGWLLRIVFTLIFGREALGVGDIHILAAAGAAGGWDIALLGLLLAVGVAIAGYVLGLLLKRSVIIPFGPWLAIGFVAALWLNRRAAGIADEYYLGVKDAWSHRPDICLMAGGLMLVGSAVAVVLAHLVRRVVEPPTE